MTLLLFTFACSIGAMIWGWPGLIVGATALYVIDLVTDYLFGE